MYSYRQEAPPKDEKVDLLAIKRAIIEQSCFDYDINYNVIWDSGLRLLSIELYLTSWTTKDKPNKFRKLVDADTLKKAYKALFEFEEKELDTAVAVFKNFKKEFNHKRNNDDKERNEKELKELSAKVTEHHVKVGHSLLNLATKATHLVEEVFADYSGIRYKVAGRNDWIYAGELYKTKLTQKGTERKVGFLHLGEIVPAETKKT